jgi:hypothetical protein
MPEKKRLVTFQHDGTGYRAVHHGWTSQLGSTQDRHRSWGEFGIYTGDGRDGDVATFDVPSGDPEGYSDGDLITMAKSALDQVADGTR